MTGEPTSKLPLAPAETDLGDGAPSVVDIPLDTAASDGEKERSKVPAAIKRAEEVMKIVLQRGLTLGKDALEKARAFDEKNAITRTAHARSVAIRESAITTVASIEQKLNLSEKVSSTSASVSQSIQATDEKFQLTKKTRSLFSAAEMHLSEAGKVILQNKAVSSSSEWILGTYSKISDYVEGPDPFAAEKSDLHAPTQKGKSFVDSPPRTGEGYGLGIVADVSAATVEVAASGAESAASASTSLPEKQFNNNPSGTRSEGGAEAVAAQEISIKASDAGPSETLAFSSKPLFLPKPESTSPTTSIKTTSSHRIEVDEDVPVF